MATALSIQKTITGHEDLGDLTQPIQALAQFYRAFNERDLALMAENWDTSLDVAMDNPLGGIKRGWHDIKTVYERIFRSPHKVTVEFQDYTLHVFNDVFYAVGRERGHLQSNLEAKEIRLNLNFRTSRIFRRIGASHWRQVHHHGSIEDPQLLSVYQSAFH
jgi:ketosteroid isomerase-like protein